jgi:hypothetical protein
MTLVIVPLVFLVASARLFPAVCLRFRTSRNFRRITSFWEASYETFIWFALALGIACLIRSVESEINAELFVIENLVILQLAIFTNTWSAIIYANYIAQIPIFGRGLPPRLQVGFCSLVPLLMATPIFQWLGNGRLQKLVSKYGKMIYASEEACASWQLPLEDTGTPPPLEDLTDSWRRTILEEYNFTGPELHIYIPRVAYLLFNMFWLFRMRPRNILHKPVGLASEPSSALGRWAWLSVLASYKDELSSAARLVAHSILYWFMVDSCKNAGASNYQHINEYIFRSNEPALREWGFGQILSVLAWAPLSFITIEGIWCKRPLSTLYSAPEAHLRKPSHAEPSPTSAKSRQVY